MTLQEAIDHMSLIMGNRSDLETKAQAALQIAQNYYQLGPTFPWFLLSEIATIDMSVDAERIQLPSDFLAEYEEGSLFYLADLDADGDDDKVFLEKGDFDDLKILFKNSDAGKPQAYSQDGRYFRLFPTPDDTYPLYMLYYKKDTPISTLSTTETCQWLTEAPYCLMGHAGQALAYGYRDGNALDKFKTMEAQGTTKLYNQNEGRKHSNRSYQIGGPAA